MEARKKSSGDVIDIRGAEGSSGGGRPGGLSLPGGAIGGIGGTAGVVIALVIVGIQVFGGGSVAGFDVDQILGPGATPPGAENPEPIPPDQDPQREFFEFSEYVFDDTQETWKSSFEGGDESYEDAKLVVYDEPSPPAAAATPPRPLARSTALPTRASISTSPSMRTWSASSAAAATSPGPT